MVAEIGGYAGLMIGFSILDFVVACQIAVSFGALSREKYWDTYMQINKENNDFENLTVIITIVIMIWRKNLEL